MELKAKCLLHRKQGFRGRSAIARTQLGASDLGNESRAGCLFVGRLEPQAMDKLDFE